MTFIKTTSLEGRLESIFVQGRHSVNYAYGQGGRMHDVVLISHGNHFSRQQCLVRFEREQLSDLPIGYFITTQVPPQFRGLSKEQYILYALWEPTMKKAGEYPRLDEIKEYFNPGHVTALAYCKKDADKKHRRVMITPNGMSCPLRNYDVIVRKELPEPWRSARLIIVEDASQLEKVNHIITEHHLIPIKMEPLQN